MKIRATRVKFGPTSHSIYDVDYVDTLVQGPPVPFGIINGVQVPVVTIQGQQRDCRVVNLYTSGLIMYMLSQFGWIGMGSIPSYTQYFPSSEDLADEYEGRPLPDLLRGERPIPTPTNEIALLIIDFFVSGGRGAAKNFEVPGDGARDQRPVAPTLTYVANTSMNVPPVPDFGVRPSNGALIWNKPKPNQLHSTIIYLSVLQKDGFDSSFLLGHDGATRVRELRISDIANPNNFQTWSVHSVIEVANQHFTYGVTLAANNSWNASNGSTCNVTILKDGQRYPEPSDVFADKVRAATRGGAKKRNKSKRRNQKKSIKKNRHQNRKRLSRRKRFY